MNLKYHLLLSVVLDTTLTSVSGLAGVGLHHSAGEIHLWYLIWQRSCCLYLCLKQTVTGLGLLVNCFFGGVYFFVLFLNHKAGWFFQSLLFIQYSIVGMVGIGMHTISFWRQINIYSWFSMLTYVLAGFKHLFQELFVISGCFPMQDDSIRKNKHFPTSVHSRDIVDWNINS